MLPIVLAKVRHQGSLPLTDSALLAEQSLVLGNNISPRRLTLSDTEQERPSVSNAGDNIPSLSCGTFMLGPGRVTTEGHWVFI